VLCELVLRHELQHSETMRQTMAIAGLLPVGEPTLGPLQGSEGWLTIPAGPFAMGAPAEGFAYDNERPRHTVELAAFAIARRPVSNASWMRFSEGGGYERREWWSDEGWAWKQEYDITHHPAVSAGHPEAPVCHVSWFEADAFARAHDARLPTEAEWEKAATWTHESGNRLAAVGQVWEWTGSHFGGYPGFVAHPYREYSEVFFGDAYRVLRGGSWATHPRVAGPTFRNWDLPLRRQIFAGVRLAKEE
jgi:gamma-glutamyl hercynylcysteine S-oxide synthase